MLSLSRTVKLHVQIPCSEGLMYLRSSNDHEDIYDIMIVPYNLESHKKFFDKGILVVVGQKGLFIDDTINLTINAATERSDKVDI